MLQLTMFVKKIEKQRTQLSNGSERDGSEAAPQEGVHYVFSFLFLQLKMEQIRTILCAEASSVSVF